MAMAALSRGWARYNELCITSPLLTKGVSGGLLFSLGDLFAQKIDGTLDSERGYNPKRTAIAFFWNAVCYTPAGHYWYCHLLPRLVAPRAASATAAAASSASTAVAAAASAPVRIGMRETVGKVIIDQSLFGPLVIGGYMTYASLANGGSRQDVEAAFRTRYWDVLCANWMVWPALQLVNFKFVPLQLQILVMNTAVVGWSTFLALNAAAKPAVRAPELDAAASAAADAAAASAAAAGTLAEVRALPANK